MYFTGKVLLILAGYYLTLVISSYTSSGQKNRNTITWNASGVKQRQWSTCNETIKFTEKVATMTFFRNRMFLEGIALGGICGIVIGSIIAFTVGESSLGAIRRFINERILRRRKVPFEYLYQ